VISARGYPEKYDSGDRIEIPEGLPAGVSVLHAGTSRNAAGHIVTSGGRVLGVTATGATLRQAVDRAYAACDQIQCSSIYYRRDIGARQLRRL
jgi:phosphoribosylamine--glycine ligase